MQKYTHDLAQKLADQGARLSDRPHPEELDRLRATIQQTWFAVRMDYFAEQQGIELPRAPELTDGR